MEVWNKTMRWKTHQAIRICATNLQEIIQDYTKFGSVRTEVVEIIDEGSGKCQLYNLHPERKTSACFQENTMTNSFETSAIIKKKKVIINPKESNTNQEKSSNIAVKYK